MFEEIFFKCFLEFDVRSKQKAAFLKLHDLPRFFNKRVGNCHPEKRLQNASRSMELLYTREKHRLAFHKANEDLMGHIASLPASQRAIVENLEKELHIGLANPLPAPSFEEKVEVRPTIVRENVPVPLSKEKTAVQKLRSKENSLKNKIRSEKKKPSPDEGKISVWEKEMEEFKAHRLLLGEKSNEKKGGEE